MGDRTHAQIHFELTRVATPLCEEILRLIDDEGFAPPHGEPDLDPSLDFFSVEDGQSNLGAVELLIRPPRPLAMRPWTLTSTTDVGGSTFAPR